MNRRIIGILVKKEMLDVLRDKKTVLMMLVVPIILYPLIFIGVLAVMNTITAGLEERTYRVAVRQESEDAEFIGYFREPKDGEDYHIEWIDGGEIEDYELALNEEEIDIFVKEEKKGEKSAFTLYYLSSATNSSYALDIVEDILREYKKEISIQKVEEAGLDADEILESVTFKKNDIASTEQSLGSIMGMILPFMLIISLLMGTMYPAIDTMAGERERGTLETILTLPVTNRQLIFSKFLTVAAIGLVSAFLNLLSMAAIAVYMYQVMDLTTENDAFSVAWGSFVPALFVTILAVLVFSLFISAVTMCVTAFAKSYKEANNYITPLMLVVMFTGYIAFIPNVELTRTMAVVPVANISLLLKNLMSFKYDYSIIALVIFSNVAYAVLAVLFLSKLYDTEAVLFGDTKDGLRLFERRSNLKKGGVPTLSDAWFMAAVSFMAMMYAGTVMQLRFGLGGVFGTQLILLMLPLLLVLYTKCDMRKTYGFYRTKQMNFLGAFLLGVGAVAIVMVMSVLLARMFPDSTEKVSESFTEILGDNVWMQILVVAMTPAVCEEMLFRGFLLSALRNRFKETASILVVAAVFGVYHMSFVKFFTTGFLGIVLCYTVCVTGSIFPAMLLHFINNLASVLLSYEPVGERAARFFPMLYDGQIRVSDVLLLLGMGCLLMALGLVILRKNRRVQNGGR